MGQVLTNASSLAFAEQTSIDVLPAQPVWHSAEPNSFGKNGSEIKTTARNPISKKRGARKGKITDLDAGSAYEEDLTISSFVRFGKGFFFATPVNEDLTFRAAPATSSGFTIPAASASQASRIQWVSASQKSLFYSRGYLLTANNGLKVVSADTAAAGTLITVAGNAAETPPTNAEVSIAGIRAEAGDLALAVSGTVGTLTSGNGSAASPIDFTTLGLTKGQFIHIGGLTSTNQFGSTAANDGTRSLGYARIRAIVAGSLSLDKMSPTLVASDGTDDGTAGTEIAVDILFGRFYRNVSVDSTEFKKQFYQAELGYEDLYETDPPTPVANPDGFEYVLDLMANVMNWDMPLSGLCKLGFEFVGTDSEDPVNNASRKTNASTPITPLFTDSFSTTGDFIRLRVIDVDETGLTTDLTDVKIKMSNNVGPEKVLARLGARFMNFGNLDIDIEATALFTNALVPARIRSNATISMDWILNNDDGAICTDIPSATVGNGAKDYPINESVKIALTIKSFLDSFFDDTLASVSLIPVVP